MEIKWCGPFTWRGDGEKSFFNPMNKEETNQPGVYLWTIPFENSYVTYYVGETGKSFINRFKEHTRNYLSGYYRVYECKELDRCAKEKTHAEEKNAKWCGLWKRNRQDPKYEQEFLSRYLELSKTIYELLGHLNIFIAPIRTNDSKRIWIESAITTILNNQNRLIEEKDTVKVKIDRGQRSCEESIPIMMSNFEPILGLCSKINA